MTHDKNITLVHSYRPIFALPDRVILRMASTTSSSLSQMELARLTARAASRRAEEVGGIVLTPLLEWSAAQVPSSLAENGIRKGSFERFIAKANQALFVATHASGRYFCVFLFPRKREAKIKTEMQHFCDANRDNLPAGISVEYMMETERRPVNYREETGCRNDDIEIRTLHLLVFTKK